MEHILKRLQKLDELYHRDNLEDDEQCWQPWRRKHSAAK